MMSTKISPFHGIIRWLFSLGIRLYFGKVEIEGLENVPRDKPFILAANHQNAFLDALIVGSLLPDPLFYLTRSDVFTKVSRPFLRLLNMIPIYRIRDGIDSLGKNDEIFDTCARLFSEGKSVMIFSEGNHGGNYYLRPLTKGTARIALGAQSKLEGDLMLLPCGINYFSHRTPRTKMMLVYGQPIPVREHLATYEENKQKGLMTLKDELASGMKKCLIIPEKSEDYEEKAREVFSAENRKLRFQELRSLASKDFSDVQVEASRRKNAWVRGLILLFSIPNFLPLFLLSRVIKIFKDKVFWSSLKFGVMYFLMPFWLLALGIIGNVFFGWIGSLILTSASVLSLFIRAELRKSS